MGILDRRNKMDYKKAFEDLAELTGQYYKHVTDVEKYIDELRNGEQQVGDNDGCETT